MVQRLERNILHCGFIFLKQVIKESEKEKLLLLHSKGHLVVSYVPSMNVFFPVLSLL